MKNVIEEVLGSDGVIGGESKIKGAVRALAWLKRRNLEIGQLRWGRGDSREAPDSGGD